MYVRYVVQYVFLQSEFENEQLPHVKKKRLEWVLRGEE